MSRSELRRLFLVVLAIMWVTGERAVHAQAPDLREIRPFMMLVVDTSGSMERKPQCACQTPSCSECLPDCGAANDISGSSPPGKKNRWAVTLEALTGTFNDFECEPLPRIPDNGMTYDLGYYLPYHQPWHCSGTDTACKATVSPTTALVSQNPDGILDTYVTRVRFGLMTFDGWDTYLGQGPLIYEQDYQWSLAEAEGGLWSYGSYTDTGVEITRKDGSVPGRFHYPNCEFDYQMDTGARGPQAAEGKLLSLNSCASPPCDPVVINTEIQTALLDTRPYGGTPIAAALDDLYYHLSSDLNDQYGSCRGRYGMLITDGYPDDDYRAFGCDCTQNSDPGAPGYCGGGASNDPSLLFCPYPKPEEVAYDLITGRGDSMTQDNPPLEKLFVVGLSIADDAVRDTLNTIAMEGGSDLIPDTGDYALFVDDIAQLKTALDGIVAGTLEPISRSLPSFINARLGVGAEQYQVSAGFQLPTNVGEPYTGILERKRFTCTGPPDGEPLLDSDRFHLTLNSQSSSPACGQTRCLYSVMPSSGFDPNDHVFTGSGAPCGVNGCTLQPLSNSTTFSTEAMGLGTGTAAEDTRVSTVNWMYGSGSLSGGATNPRIGKRLGDIYHSSPRLVGPPQFDNGDAAFNAFRRRPEVAQRPNVLYVGTNDGILHAFAMEGQSGPPTFTAGTELWGFIPPMLIDDLPTNLTQHQTTMDGTPVIKDVYFERAPASDISDGSEYHTVLITGMRGGGAAYVALDVTDPTDPKFLWQFTDTDCSDGACMGLTYGRPVIGQARFMFEVNGTPVERQRAVAILPGGKGELGAVGDLGPGCDPGLTTPTMRTLSGARYETLLSPLDTLGHQHRGDVRCWKAPGRSLYFVDVETGQLLKTLDSSTFPSPLVGSPVLYSDEVGTLASRAFVMDADGVIWRIHLQGVGDTG
ncbi:MAG: PilC/PilY family type IV pilus protein, partial [Myxococcales bacterium]|nr:PilC/PilY family type IV pilus protein [Myxococcales bacterium]